MALAVDAVMKDDGLGVPRAAEVYNVPQSTLGDCTSGRVFQDLSVDQSGTEVTMKKTSLFTFC